jgi:5-carboxymethyl-2-hydroxymuconate isomerase
MPSALKELAMPHFVIDCSEGVVAAKPVDELMREIHDIAEASGLFRPGDIKVRVRPFLHFTVADARRDFIHVFANIMEGRTIEQRADLSQAIITKLKSMFPEVPAISMNVFEFEKATYCNRNMA